MEAAILARKGHLFAAPQFAHGLKRFKQRGSQIEGRAELKFKGESLDLINGVVPGMLMDNLRLQDNQMNADFHPATFVLGKGSPTISSERGRGGTIRFQFQGQREIMFVRTSDLRSFMTTIGMGNITPDNIRSFFKSMGKDVIDQFAQ